MALIDSIGRVGVATGKRAPTAILF
jgi:hypothetical protein